MMTDETFGDSLKCDGHMVGWQVWAFLESGQYQRLPTPTPECIHRSLWIAW